MTMAQQLSLADLFRKFPDDEAAEAWLSSVRWPDGPRCSHCGHDNILSGAAHKTMPYRCRAKECRKRFSVRIGTTMQDSKLGYQKWAIAMFLLTTERKGRSSAKLARDLGITQKSAWHLAHRIRESWDVSHEPLDDRVEIDETFIGGKARWMHQARKQRGVAKKAIVIGARQRGGRMVAEVMPAITSYVVERWIRQRVEPGTIIYTDDAGCYRSLWLGYKHMAINHSKGQYVDGDATTNGIESMWVVLKGSYRTHHWMSRKHLQRYVNMVVWHHNSRRMSTVDQMAETVRGLVGKQLMYRDLIAGP